MNALFLCIIAALLVGNIVLYAKCVNAKQEIAKALWDSEMSAMRFKNLRDADLAKIEGLEHVAQEFTRLKEALAAEPDSYEVWGRPTCSIVKAKYLDKYYVTVKVFESDDQSYDEMEAAELIEKLNEK
jgi:hypothetical protein